MELKLGTIPITAPETTDRRMSMLLWGLPGCGKTVLAGTAPGKKLFLNFDPDGFTSLNNKHVDYLVADMSKAASSITERFKEEDPLNLGKLFTEAPEITTLVVDSITSFADMAMQWAVPHATAAGIKGISVEDPGFKGYGRKHAWTYAMVMNILRITAKYKKHVIFIAHEDNPTKDSSGVVLHITMMLGSSLAADVPVKISEIWHVSDTEKERRIAIRPCRMRRPMKTRMFLTNKEPEFKWTYDADAHTGEGIADWFKRWEANNFMKIALPT